MNTSVTQRRIDVCRFTKRLTATHCLESGTRPPTATQQVKQADSIMCSDKVEGRQYVDFAQQDGRNWKDLRSNLSLDEEGWTFFKINNLETANF